MDMGRNVTFDEDPSSEEPSSSEISDPSTGTTVQSKNLIPTPFTKHRLSYASPPMSVATEDNDNTDTEIGNEIFIDATQVEQAGS
jgi:hypothetical protein